MFGSGIVKCFVSAVYINFEHMTFGGMQLLI